MLDFILDTLAAVYPWTTALHVMSVISWMAGLFYLPRLFVHHTERAPVGSDSDELLRMMEHKLFKLIMNPASIATWLFGLCLVFTPGVVDWGQGWPWIKAACVIAMTWFHHWLGHRLRDFANGANTRSGRSYRMMNEVPTVLMIVIVLSVIVRPF